MSDPKVIYKHTLEPTQIQIVKLPADYRIISVIEQRDQIVMYTEHGLNLAKIIPATIYIFGTGLPFEKREDMKFIGTVSLGNGSLVFHVYYTE